MSGMNNGHKSFVIRYWNGGMPATAIATKMNLDPSEVLSYLQSRPGYPGKLFKRHRGMPGRTATREENSGYGRTGPTPVVSLPRLRFLEGDGT